MYSIIHKAEESSANRHLIILVTPDSDWSKFGLSENELGFVKSELEKDKLSIELNQYSRSVFIECFKEQDVESKSFEKARERGAALLKKCNAAKIEEVELVSASDSDLSMYTAEGMALANYQFLKYFTDADKKRNSLREIYVHADERAIRDMNAVVAGTLYARDLVNEPLSYLTALQFSDDMVALGEEAGFKVEVLHKKQIESLKMGGCYLAGGCYYRKQQIVLYFREFISLAFDPQNYFITMPLLF